MRVKTEEKREAILVAAKDVFLEYGFEAASMAEIAKVTGGSKQTLYSYFVSKEELFVAVMLAFSGRLILPAFQMLDDDLDFAAGLRAFGRAFLTAISDADVVAFRRVLIAEGARSGVGRLFYENGPLIGLTRLAGFLERQMALGRMKTVPAFMAGEQFIALCESGALRLYMLGARGPISQAEIADAADAAVDLFTAGYGITG
jgi:AcrR family transcriptional regulator